jgi:hypothetical protein
MPGFCTGEALLGWVTGEEQPESMRYYESFLRHENVAEDSCSLDLEFKSPT